MYYERNVFNFSLQRLSERKSVIIVSSGSFLTVSRKETDNGLDPDFDDL
jgi:hypothetical protein